MEWLEGACRKKGRLARRKGRLGRMEGAQAEWSAQVLLEEWLALAQSAQVPCRTRRSALLPTQVPLEEWLALALLDTGSITEEWLALAL